MTFAATVTPVLGTFGTSEADISGSVVAANEEWSVDLMLCNTNSAAVSVRVYVADASSGKAYRMRDIQLGGNTSIDVFRGLKLPAGYRIGGRAGSAASIDYIFAAAKRSTQ